MNKEKIDYDCDNLVNEIKKFHDEYRIVFAMAQSRKAIQALIDEHVKAEREKTQDVADDLAKSDEELGEANRLINKLTDELKQEMNK